MLVQILVFAAAVAIMAAVVLPGHMPVRSTGHGTDSESNEPASARGAAGVVYSVVLVVILCLLVTAGFSALSGLSGK